MPASSTRGGPSFHRSADCDPRRGARVWVKKVPNPAVATGSSRATASPMVENTAPTLRLAVALVADVSAATCEARWVLFIFAARNHEEHALSGRAPRYPPR